MEILIVLKKLLYKNRYGVDGNDRKGLIGYPISRNKTLHKKKEHLRPPTIEDRVRVCKQHFKSSNSFKGNTLIVEMKRHYSNYFKGILF